MTARLSLQHLAAPLGHTHDEHAAALLCYRSVQPWPWEENRERSSNTTGAAGPRGSRRPCILTLAGARRALGQASNGRARTGGCGGRVIRVMPRSSLGRLTLLATPIAGPPHQTTHNTLGHLHPLPGRPEHCLFGSDSRVSRARKVVARLRVKFETLWRPYDPPEVRSVAPRGVTWLPSDPWSLKLLHGRKSRVDYSRRASALLDSSFVYKIPSSAELTLDVQQLFSLQASLSKH